MESIVMLAGGWPMAMQDDTWDMDENPWQTVDRHYARLTGTYAFFDVNVHPPEDVQEFRAIRVITCPVKPLSPSHQWNLTNARRMTVDWSAEFSSRQTSVDRERLL